MKNVTITMDDELYAATRVMAARNGMSMARYIARAAAKLNSAEAESVAESLKKRQLQALAAILASPKWDVSVAGRMPSADDRNG
jgi:plasmid stability protein